MQINVRKQRGDTIVEVLISIAVVSLTLTGAYASVNRSANATRTAQERGEALKWAQTQVEQIKASKIDLANSTYTKFCYTTNLTLQNNGQPCLTGSGVQYKAQITQNVASLGSFSVIVNWDPIDKAVTQNSVELDYVK